MAIITKRQKLSDSASAQSLSDADSKVLDLIKSKEENGISMPQIKYGTQLPPATVTKSLNNLITRNLIKEFININNKRSKHYIGFEFKPSKEVGGGEWYTNGELDVEFVEVMRDACLKTIRGMKVTTMDELLNFIHKKRMFNFEVSKSQINEIVQYLVVNGDVEEVVSNEKVCYRPQVAKMLKGGAMSSIPCGVCPHMSDCTPDGSGGDVGDQSECRSRALETLQRSCQRNLGSRH